MTNTRNIAHGYKALVGLVNMMKGLHGDNLDRNAVSSLDSVLGHARNLIRDRRTYEAVLHNEQPDTVDFARMQLNASRDALQHTRIMVDLKAHSERMGRRGNTPYAISDSLATAILATIHALIYSA
jgi:hypothetical protein